ncbi:hypothetical protein L6164_029212 [Bauhinia variegata]|uniref:Uncharacterized protein n=1 Tax=Bauhinia variegata TaxID=167791 RepID=A0ACB9L918_BAUVA|nr:hypothetical protein L6164_029212 [Bauhinia variegata]
MGIDIKPECRGRSSHTSYTVTIHGRAIPTQVTSSCRSARYWIHKFLRVCPRHQPELLVGLDIEWRPNFTRGGVQNPVAIIQLCISKSCLIFQLHQASSIPKSLYEALQNPNIVYAGLGITRDAKKLEEDYGLQIARCIKLETMAAKVYDQKELQRAGLKTLVEYILEEDIPKPKHVTLSNWQAKTLTCDQVCYACVDAYYSYKLAKQMLYDD